MEMQLQNKSCTFQAKTFLITGGAGFIGSNIAATLYSLGANIVISDRLRSGDKWKNLQDLVLQDIIPPEFLVEWSKCNAYRLSGIIHMGAISATTERNVDKIIENNFLLTTQLWKVSSDNRLPFIYASSAATYGNGEQGFDDNQSLQSQANLRPMNPYGWSKLLVDKRFASDVELGHPVPPQWAGLKFFNVYGPNECHKGDMRSVINKLYPLVKNGNDVTLFKSHKSEYFNGGQLRDFIYVKDCVQVILWLLENPHVSGLFNVGTGRPRSFLDLVKSLDHVMHKKSSVHYIDMPEDIRDRYQYYTCANVSKLRQVGYHSEFTTLEDGISDYVNSYLDKQM
jgi:ADP-L-glycero-D-manno-heptose 6-epimerase